MIPTSRQVTSFPAPGSRRQTASGDPGRGPAQSGETPLGRHRHDLSREGFAYDAAQVSLVNTLQSCFDTLTEPPLLTDLVLPWWKRASGKMELPEPPQIKGVYIWGPVGRGKTYLMDSFYQCLPAGTALRLHFHRFMQRVHEGLRKYSGHKNPLQWVAKDLAGDARILCLDEFFVEDIGDAMILAGLLEALIERGCVLVVTSNTAPEDLYKDGLQRQRFLPAIDLLQCHTQVMCLDGKLDYRLRNLQPNKNYFAPLSKHTHSQL
ncbi:MAG: cell division protein ZapE, partial [Gammaproteobacteria bacterium]|nr:cell division protein ZapE [Gammaproteobacteria bacterium]